VNSLLTGLRACVWNEREWITGANPAKTTTSYFSRAVPVPKSRGEIGLRTVQADSPACAYPNTGLHDILGDVTVFWRGSLDSYATAGAMFLGKVTSNGGSATPFWFGALTTGKLTLGRAHATDFRNWGTTTATCPTAQVFNAAVAVGGGAEINTAPTFYIDTVGSAETPGASSGGTGTGTPTLSANGLRTGTRPDNSIRTDGHTILAYAWARKLTPTELAMLFADPYLVRDLVLAEDDSLAVEGPPAVPAAPVAAFSGTPLSGAASLSVAFTDSSTNTPTSWLWEKNDGGGWVNFASTPTAQNPTESFAAGTWDVRLTATNVSGFDAEEKLDYIVASPPAPVAAFSGTPVSGSAPLPVVFTDASTNTPTSWAWEKNDGGGWVNFAGSPTAQNPTENFAEGTWDVRLTSTNATGSDAEEKLDYVVVSAAVVSTTTSTGRSRKLGFLRPPRWRPN
jgi:PKD repeat protein